MYNCVSNFNVQLDDDFQTVKEVLKRQKFENARKLRIFNNKTRLIGVDVEGLESQVQEKKKNLEEEQQRERHFVENAKVCDRIALALENEEKKERKKLAQEINFFRTTYQRPENGREYDLNDRDRLKKDLPCRIRDDDPRCGPSSCQKFECENLLGAAGAKEKHDQIKTWLDEQIQEKKNKLKEQKDADQAYTETVIVRDGRAMELNELEMFCKRQLDLAVDRYNKALNTQKRYKTHVLKEKEQRENLAEIYNNLTSDLLTENPDVAQSGIGASRVIGYLYKGMTKRQKDDIRLVQEQQRKENDIRRQNEQSFNQDWDKVSQDFRYIVAAMDHKILCEQKQREKDLMQKNVLQGQEHKAHIDYVDKVLYKNKVTATFFEQFNKTSR